MKTDWKQSKQSHKLAQSNARRNIYNTLRNIQIDSTIYKYVRIPIEDQIDALNTHIYMDLMHQFMELKKLPQSRRT